MFKSRKSAGMLGSVQSKLAHATLIPPMGNSDLKTLQDLITAEKAVVTSVQKLALDFNKASEALKAWGTGEGDDLGDILSHSSGMLLHVSAALSQYATHEQSIRTHLKNIRTREENLDETKRRRRAVGSKADAAEKKLSKMGQENKNLQEQTDLLTRLREEMRSLDTEILNEEARLGDYKRRISKDLLHLKFGGLLEAAEKITIVGDLGKLLIDEMPLATTEPGQARVYYTGYEKTSHLASEATRCVGEVTFAPSTSNAAPSGRLSTSSDPGAQQAQPLAPPTNHQQSSTFSGYPQNPAPGGYGPPPNEFGQTGPASPVYAQYPTNPASPIRTGDDGSRIQSNSQQQYATLPANGSGGRDRPESAALPPVPIENRDTIGPIHDKSFTDSVADALAADSYINSTNSPANEHPPASYASPPIPPPDNHRISAVEPAGNPWSSDGQRHQLQDDGPHRVEEDETNLPYAAEPAAAGRRGKGSEDFNYPYDENAFFVRNHAASSRPLSPPNSEHPAQQPQRPQSPPQLSATDEAAANAAAAREVGRELDTLGFNSAKSSNQPPNDLSPAPYIPSYAPPAGPPPSSSVLQTQYRPTIGVDAPLIPPSNSFVSSAGPPSPSTRTISASAFRRSPAPKSTMEAIAQYNPPDEPPLTPPLQFKKKAALPVSPYPNSDGGAPRLPSFNANRGGSPAYYTPNEGPEFDMGGGNQHTHVHFGGQQTNAPPIYSQSGGAPGANTGAPGGRRGPPSIPDEEEFMRELQRLDGPGGADGHGANPQAQGAGSPRRGGGGYDNGRFATNLE